MKQNVVITAFGPFGDHPVNASSLALQHLKEGGFSKEEESVNIVTKELPVVYKAVELLLKQIWEELSPAFVIHIGVSGLCTEVKLETHANETCYERPDIVGHIPVDKETWPTMTSCLALQDVVTELQDCGDNFTPVSVSNDPGQYLCQYSFHHSLKRGQGRAVFIHVPTTDKSTTDNTARSIRKVLQCLISHYNKSECSEEKS